MESQSETIKVSFLQLFRYGTRTIKAITVIGVFFDIILGAILPINFIVYSDVVNELVDLGSNDRTLNMTMYKQSVDSININILSKIKFFCALGSVALVSGYIQCLCFQYTSSNQGLIIKKKLYSSMLYHDMNWFSKNSVGSLLSYLNMEVDSICNGIGTHLSVFLQYFTSFITGFIISFSRAWLLSLVCLSIVPMIVLAFVLIAMSVVIFTRKEIEAYADAGAIVQEVLYSIRIVIGYGGEKKELGHYRAYLEVAKRMGIKKHITLGFCLGFISFCIFGSGALAFGVGSKFILDNNYRPGLVVQTFFCIVIGSISLGNSLPSMPYFAAALASASKVFAIIETKSKIDPRQAGIMNSEIEGEIEFKEVHFSYPRRSDVEVLSNFSLNVKAGETVAFIGFSGSGKSTLIQLLQRFYDVDKGEVLIDGVNIKNLNLRWYRDHIGVVQQDSLLFNGTVAENIFLGNLEASYDEMVRASMQANAHDFISALPQGYDTYIGDMGSLLSGGQRQRVCIARAIIRNPTIILLDEATSSLDNESERVVQQALDDLIAKSNCTVVMIAHRLSTVRNADKIVHLTNGGVIVEMGNHDELMKLKGPYYEMINKDIIKKERKIVDTDSIVLSSKCSKTDENIQQRQFHDYNDVVIKDNPSLKRNHLRRLFKMARPDYPLLFFGTFFSMLCGVSQPIFSLLFADMVGVFALVNDPAKMRHETLKFSLEMLALAFAILVSDLIRHFFLGIVGERLTLRVRMKLFRHILNQEIGWFDEEANKVGSLALKLSRDAQCIQRSVSSLMSVIFESGSSIISVLFIIFYYNWRLAFVALSFSPIIVIGGIMQVRVAMGKGLMSFSQNVIEKNANILQESLSNIKVVAVLNRQEYFYKEFVDTIRLPNLSKFFMNISALLYGMSQSSLFFTFAACFSYGIFLINRDLIEFQDIFRVLGALIFGSLAIGRSLAFLGEIAESNAAGKRIFNIIDQKSKIVTDDPHAAIPDEPFDGVVTFKNINFSYPTRQDCLVLKGFTLQISANETVALVGESGCGKSTLIQLLSRFYSVDSGEINFNNKFSIGNTSAHWTRRQMAVVQQMPVLFNRTIMENICYGDNERSEISLEEVIKVATEANIHSFIISLPLGYDTIVGEMGGLLSGGQKQRISIARALLRKPKLLLLDEATSALDAESEQIVQESIDAARKNRSVLIIAHRLSTIKNADKIAVLVKGHVEEIGTHNELMNKKGHYYMMNTVNKQ